MTADGTEQADPKVVVLTAAVTGLEKTLLDLCQDIVAVPVCPDDDFFELGVDSLAVAELFTVLERTLQIRIPMRVAAECPTVRTLAKWITSAAPQDSSVRSLVRMSRTTAPRRLFFVHGVGGHVLVFEPLARALDGNVDFYAFEAVGRNDGPSDRSIDAMARRYLRDMKRVQPEGPYNVGGYSMGGVVALQMAHLLQDQGDAVNLVAMLDTPTRFPDLVGVRNRSLEFVARSLGVDPPVIAPYERIKEGALALSRRLQSGRGHPSLGVDDILRFVDTYLVNGDAWSAHQPKPYGGSVLLVYTSGPNSPITEPAAADRAADVLGWTGIVNPRRLAVVELPGDHWTMLSDHAQQLAEILQDEILAAGRTAEIIEPPVRGDPS